MDPSSHLHPARHMPGKAIAAVAAALVGLALMVSACSGSPSSPGVASAGDGHAKTADAVKTGALAYSKCMQTHGIADFPDPNSKGQLSIQGGSGSDLNPNDPQFQTATKECAKYQPQPTAAQKADAFKKGIEMANCMHAHGIKDFPDPNAQGELQIHATPGSDLDPSDPQFVAAQNACAHILGGPKIKGAPAGGQSTSGSGGSGSGFTEQIG
ncbi:MAG TPA: hypothetical protein VGG38_08555 [Acidimicrobiales bacterium]